MNNTFLRHLQDEVNFLSLRMIALQKSIRNYTDNNCNSAGRSRKLRSDRVYLSNSEKQKAYRERKKNNTTQVPTQEIGTQVSNV